jgi:hypothetical protein
MVAFYGIHVGLEIWVTIGDRDGAMAAPGATRGFVSPDAVVAFARLGAGLHPVHPVILRHFVAQSIVDKKVI